MSHAVDGVIDVLNTGLGHLTLKFDPADPIERERASRVVFDLLRRGATLFVTVDGVLTRVLDFDPARAEYIIADAPPRLTDRLDPNWDAEVLAPRPQDLELPPPAAGGPAAADPLDDGVPIPPRNGRRGGRRRVPAEEHKATAVGRTAGG